MQVTLSQEVIELAEEYKKLSSEVFPGFAASTTTVVNHTSKVSLTKAIEELKKTIKRKK